MHALDFMRPPQTFVIILTISQNQHQSGKLIFQMRAAQSTITSIPITSQRPYRFPDSQTSHIVNNCPKSHAAMENSISQTRRSRFDAHQPIFLAVRNDEIVRVRRILKNLNHECDRFHPFASGLVRNPSRNKGFNNLILPSSVR